MFFFSFRLTQGKDIVKYTTEKSVYIHLLSRKLNLMKDVIINALSSF